MHHFLIKMEKFTLLLSDLQNEILGHELIQSGVLGKNLRAPTEEQFLDYTCQNRFLLRNTIMKLS